MRIEQVSKYTVYNESGQKEITNREGRQNEPAMLITIAKYQ